MPLIFFWYPKCSTCRKAKAFLDNQGIQYNERDIKLENPTYEEIKALHHKSGQPLKKFFNTSGLKYKELKLANTLSSINEDDQLKLLAEDGMLVKRPILAAEDFVLTGFREDEWKKALSEKKV